MGDEAGEHAPGMKAVLRRLQRGAHLRGVVRVVVDEGDTAHLAADLEAPADALESPDRFHRGGNRHPDQNGDSRADRKSTRLNSSHGYISYAVFCLKKKNNNSYRNCAFQRTSQLYLIYDQPLDSYCPLTQFIPPFVHFAPLATEMSHFTSSLSSTH